MLDMGGVSAADTANAMKINVGKNSKLQVIALDFDLISRSIDAMKEEQKDGRVKLPEENGRKAKDILPDVNRVENIANLLNVKLGGERTPLKVDVKEDDLSRLTGSGNRETEVKEKEEMATPLMDIRAKYAKKLRSKVDGGIAGLENMKNQRDDALQKGDAAGHLYARKVAASKSVSTSGSKWIATSGLGKLLDFLNGRSMKICLLPSPHNHSENSWALEKSSMEDLKKQLPHVDFSICMENESGKETSLGPNDLLESITSTLKSKSLSTIVVSDKDIFLRSAREKGMYTCRVRQKNQPRGNVTTDYTVETVKEVEDVVNEVNGISFNSVFSSARS